MALKNVLYSFHYDVTYPYIAKRNFCGRKLPPAGSTGTRLPFDPTSQHLRFRNPQVQGSPAKMLMPSAKPADLSKHSLAKVEEGTFQIKFDAKFFRFGMEHFKYPAIRGQIFPNSQTIYDR
ncbi:hypothetical protein T12_7775 [Trichinella patagoniensis]|uniref:Uncharacterized protein n=1 Tax=Trichinella patagoniensis TaxID=990121 RepID=A0A0V0ZAG5_9BILA|nr:hypothetical protein T12_7775 [Trichinella patagoniensis]